MNQRFLIASCLLFAACAVDPDADPADPIDVPPVTNTDDGLAPQPADPSVRKVSTSCGQDFDGRDLVSVQASSDLGVRFAIASLHRGADSDGLELDARFAEPIQVGGATIFSKTSLVNLGRFSPDEASPVSCASLPELAVKVIVAFEDGRVGCAIGGNAVEAAKLRCED